MYNASPGALTCNSTQPQHTSQINIPSVLITRFESLPGLPGVKWLIAAYIGRNPRKLVSNLYLTTTQVSQKTTTTTEEQRGGTLLLIFFGLPINLFFQWLASCIIYDAFRVHRIAWGDIARHKTLMHAM